MPGVGGECDGWGWYGYYKRGTNIDRQVNVEK